MPCPYTTDDIASQAIAAAEAGASILHLHARNPDDGSVSLDIDHFGGFLPRIKQATNCGGEHFDRRFVENHDRRPDCPSAALFTRNVFLNMGSMNFSFHPLAKRYDTWKFDWEKDYVENSDTYIFRNTFRDIGVVGRNFGPHTTLNLSMNVTMSAISTICVSAWILACLRHRSFCNLCLGFWVVSDRRLIILFL